MSSADGYAKCTNAKLRFSSAIASSLSVSFNAFLTDFSVLIGICLTRFVVKH